MPNPLSLSKKDRKILIEKMRDAKQYERITLPRETLFVPSVEKHIENPKLVCPKCKKEVDKLTKDHIIPKWIFNPANLDSLRIKAEIISTRTWSNVSSRNKQKICSPCNEKKAGKIDFTDPFSRRFIRILINKFSEELSKNDPLFQKVKIICKCNHI